MAIELAPRQTASLTRSLGRGVGLFDRAEQVRASLEGVRHPGVVKPTRILEDPDGDVVAVMPRVAGMDLAAMLAIRPKLSAGECVWLASEVASALAAMHAVGVAHGDVSPGNIVITPHRPVVVDVLAGARDDERGTVPFAAPDRVRGASPASDTYALARVVLHAADDDAVALLDPWMDPLLNEDPGARPAASSVAMAIHGCAAAVPFDVPEVAIAADVRARAGLPENATTRVPAARGWRVRRRMRRVLLVGLGALVFGGALSIAVPLLGAASGPDPGLAPGSPAVAARQLTEWRFEAFAHRDGASLVATSVPGTAAAREAARSAGLLAGADGAAARPVLTVRSTQVLSWTGADAQVRVAYEWYFSGEEGGSDSPQTQAVDLELRWLDGVGWRVQAAQLVE